MNRWLARIEDGSMAALLAFMTILTFVQVVLRYGFNSGFIWSLEATTYAFGWLVLVGMAAGLRENGHFVVELFVTALSPRLQRWVALLAVGLCLGYAALMGYGGFLLVERLMALGNDARDLPAPRWVFLGIMPVGFALFGWRLLALARDILNHRRSGLGRAETDPAMEID